MLWHKAIGAGGAGGGITVEGFTTTAAVSSSTPSHNLPSGIASGDKLVMIVSMDDTAEPTPTITGWTNVQSVTWENAVGQCWLFAKDATGSEGTSVTVNLSKAKASTSHVFRLSGAAAGFTTASIAVNTAGSGNSTSPSWNAISPGWGSEEILWIAAMVFTGGTTVSAASSGYDEVTDVLVDGDGHDTHVSAKIATASSDTPGNATLAASRDWETKGIAIRPA